MSRPWRSLRVQLAVLGFLAIYVPVLLLFGVTSLTEEETVETVDHVGDGPAEAGQDETSDTVEGAGTAGTAAATVAGGDSSPRQSPWVTWTVVLLGPAAAGLAWWWAGRAVGPLDRVRAVAEDIEATDLGRRIGLDRGPTEVVSLAASFDAMLDRLEQAAETQRRLVEETSHELRTPLSVLATNADVVLAHPDPTAEVYRQGLERSKAAALRLQATIDELLVDARGRARTIARRPADLMSLVRAVVDDARVLASAGDVELSLTGPPEAPCRLDEPTVRRAVSNLVDNAVRHAPAGSTVEVAVEVAGTEARVTVTDHGPGIPAEQQDHVFERFWRGGSDAPGTGLGLPIARQVALAHGGNLTLTSPTPTGPGCTFTLTLRP